MNRVEAEYEQELRQQLHDGNILWYRFEAVKLKLAENTFYTPDFLVMHSTGTLAFHEVKGFWQDDARVKIKVAAELFPFAFIAVKKRPKRVGGGWDTEHF